MSAFDDHEDILANHSIDNALYLLIDPRADCPRGHALHLASLANALGEQALQPVLRPDFAHAPQACPVLVTLATPGALPCIRLMRQTTHWARQSPEQFVPLYERLRLEQTLHAGITAMSILPKSKLSPQAPRWTADLPSPNDVPSSHCLPYTHRPHPIKSER